MKTRILYLILIAIIASFISFNCASKQATMPGIGTLSTNRYTDAREYYLMGRGYAVASRGAVRIEREKRKTMIPNKNNKCSKIRSLFHRIIEDRAGLDTPWVHEHIINCPRCQRRLVAIGKVNIALSALKSQPTFKGFSLLI